MDQLAFLTQRVYRLEQEVAALKGAPLAEIAAVPPMTAQPAPVRAAPPPPRTAVPPAPVPVARATAAGESELVGTWFARIGAVALLIGAAFAFKYGIDRGIIGPAARVVIGVAAGIALVATGEWARLRSWPRFAQAVAAAGLGTLVLSVWAGFHLYDLMSAAPTFIALVAVTVLGAGLAVRHDSEALAILAAVLGFMNPLLVGGRSEPGAMYAYVLVLDAGIIAVGALKGWAAVDVVAAGASWILLAVGLGEATTGIGIGYATALFAMFSAASLSRPSETGEPWMAFLTALNGGAYIAAGLWLLDRDVPGARGAFAAFVAAGELVIGAAVHRIRPNRSTEATNAVLAAVFLTIAVGFQWHGIDASIGWAVEAVALGAAASLLGSRMVRQSALAVLSVSVVSSVFVHFQGGSEYHPDQLIASKESLVFIVQIAAAFVIAAVLAKGNEWERDLAAIAFVGANVLAVTWMSFEAFAHYRGEAGTVSTGSRQAFQFTLSAIWGLYAALLLGLGVAFRSRLVRLMSIALLGFTIAKMALADLWTLTTGQRVLGFLGLGAVLLAASLTYHRFRELIVGPDEPAPANGSRE